jgi:hypothetical protein
MDSSGQKPESKDDRGLLEKEWALLIDPNLVSAVDRYDSGRPGCLAGMLEVVEGLAERLANEDKGWRHVIEDLAGDSSELAAKMISATLEFRGHIEWNAQVSESKITVPLNVWRQVAAAILCAEQEYFNRPDTAEGYRIARDVMKRNVRPFKYASSAKALALA